MTLEMLTPDQLPRWAVERVEESRRARMNRLWRRLSRRGRVRRVYHREARELQRAAAQRGQTARIWKDDRAYCVELE